MLTTRRLGIPDDAERVLMLSESSHWDPNWMMTSEQYFRFGVRRTLDLVLDELDRDERRVWSADCVFFLAMYWDRRPDRRERLAAAVNSGRLRLTTSGVTTQDTLLPPTESVLRDFLIGQEWLRARGMHQEPELAYFPDSFGHAPSLPTLLRSAGFDKTIVTRIDGGYFLGSDWETPGRFPRPGSSARSLTELGSADFVWRDRSGAEVLAHWHPFTYGQGDMLASFGPMRYMGLPTSVSDRSPRRVAARLERHADKLAPLARTRYLLCPIGMDFVHPIRDLLELIDHYNEHAYPRTGLWVTNAGGDDYLDLVDEHGGDLPVLELDPNPYWTGFYASRQELKRSHRLLVDRLVAAEAGAVADGGPRAARIAGELADAWWTAAVGNHHDFVTGTSPDRVVRAEQVPWLESAHAAVRRSERTTHEPFVEPTSSGKVRHDWSAGTLLVDAGRIVAVIDPARGASLREVRLDGELLLEGLGGDLVAYDDHGGLWRMGGEYRGGRFAVVDTMSRHAAEVHVEATPTGGLSVVADGLLDGRAAQRCYRFEHDRPSIEVHTAYAAGDRRTVTVRLPAPGRLSGLHMDQPGGVVTRPVRRHFDPTFWPVASWLATEPVDGPGGRSVAVGSDVACAVSASADGRLEVVIARNATKELAWRVLPIPACPARGHERGITTGRVTLWWPDAPTPAALVDDCIRLGPSADRRRLQQMVGRVLHLRVEGADAGGALEVLALKHADRGDGIIARFIDWNHRPGRRVHLRTSLPLIGAQLCDVRERDLHPLEPLLRQDGTELVIEPRTAITSVRLLPGDARSSRSQLRPGRRGPGRE